MNRSTGIAGVLAVAIATVGITTQAASQERATLAGDASCIDAEGKYTITWTLTLNLEGQQTAVVQTFISDTDYFDGIDLIGAPQHEGYPFQAQAGNIFTAGRGPLNNGPNTDTTLVDTTVYDPASITAAGVVTLSGTSTEVQAALLRPSVCAASNP